MRGMVRLVEKSICRCPCVQWALGKKNTHTHNTKHTQKQTNAQQQQKNKANTQTKNKKQNNNDEKEKAGKQRACVSRPPATQLASQPNQPATQTPNAEPVREIV